MTIADKMKQLADAAVDVKKAKGASLWKGEWIDRVEKRAQQGEYEYHENIEDLVVAEAVVAAAKEDGFDAFLEFPGDLEQYFHRVVVTWKGEK